jgi:hypothetical protein
MRLWKALGLAGLAGVAATGVVIARDRRRRTELTPDEIRARLRERVDGANAPGPAQPDSTESSARP